MAPNLGAYLTQPLHLGDIQVAGSLTVTPLFGLRSPERLLSLEEGLRLGAEARELPKPEVQRIVIWNPTPHALLLLDGEGVNGAQQNRIVDGTVIVPAGTRRTVHVCCVERKRWEGARRSETFRTSQQVMSPALRSVKSRSARRTGRGDQTAVWEQVGHSIASTGTITRTLSVTDVFAQNGPRLEELIAGFRCEPGQVGMVVAVADRIWAVDLVADPGAFASIYPRLLRGYAMDAARVTRRAAVSRCEIMLALGRLLARPVVEAARTRCEQTLRFGAGTLPVEGTVTLEWGRLVALSALLPGAPQGEVALEERPVRTSETHPIAVSWLRSPHGGLGLTVAPGKRGASSGGPPWIRDVDRDLVRLRTLHGADVLVCLLTDDDLSRYGLPDYAARVAASGMTLRRLPITAGSVPAVGDVHTLVRQLRPLLERGARVVVHCGAGLGRSGTIAGCLLVELGLSPEAALEALKTRHSRRCPETTAQREFVRGFASALADAS